MSTLALGQVVIDASHAATLAAFWSALLERPTLPDPNPYFAVIPPADDCSFPALMFLGVPEPRTDKNRLHLDLATADPAAAVQRACALGATHVGDFEEYGIRWTTLADPEGNLFDVALPHPAAG